MAFEAGASPILGTPLRLDGLAGQWEQCAELRRRIRDNRRLFVSSKANNFDPMYHTVEAGLNKDVLAPALKCLHIFRGTDGSLQLCSISQMEKEYLGQASQHFQNYFFLKV